LNGFCNGTPTLLEAGQGALKIAIPILRSGCQEVSLNSGLGVVAAPPKALAVSHRFADLGELERDVRGSWIGQDLEGDLVRQGQRLGDGLRRTSVLASDKGKACQEE
jgi:hypothetical protein